MSPTELTAEGLLDERREGIDGPEAYDFRRPSKFSREHVRSLEVAHEVFGRRFSSGIGAALRSMLQLEPLSVDQVSYDDYIRSMPNPSVLTVVALPPLPGAAIVELNVQLALVLVDRLLGGKGLPVDVRRPTELETFLLRELMVNAVDAFRDTMEPLLEVTPEIASVEFNPQLVQVAAPSDMALLLSYRATIAQGRRAEGLLTICYPFPTLAPAMNRLVTQLWEEPALSLDAGDPYAAMRENLGEVSTELSVQLRQSTITPRELLSLQPGDVLRLDHPAGAVVRGVVEGDDVLVGHLGRRGRKLAVQVAGWVAEPSPLPRPAPPAPPPLLEGELR
jgi:flagellar motor switch protein FliM